MLIAVSPKTIQLPPGTVVRFPGTWKDYQALGKLLGESPLAKVKYRTGEIAQTSVSDRPDWTVGATMDDTQLQLLQATTKLNAAPTLYASTDKILSRSSKIEIGSRSIASQYIISFPKSDNRANCRSNKS